MRGFETDDTMVPTPIASEVRSPSSTLMAVHRQLPPVLIHGQFLGAGQLGGIPSFFPMCLFEEAAKASLEPGKLPDFAIFSRDPTPVEPNTLADLSVLETTKEGKTIFRCEPGARANRAAPDIIRSCWHCAAIRGVPTMAASTMRGAG